jgi:hypothetical protein
MATDTEIKLPDISRTPEETKAQGDILRLGEDRLTLAKGYSEDVKKRADELQSKLSEPRPKMPEAPEEPPPPSRKIRPFADGAPGEPPMQTLNKAVLSLGLMAQGIAGVANKYPVGALSAITGAMTGWAEGDKERGDREFKDWGAQVQQMRDHYEQQRQHVADLIADHEGDIESLKAKLAVEGIKMGAQKGLIDEAQRNPEAILKFAEANRDRAMEVYKMFNELMAKKLMRDHQDAALAETKRLNDAKIEHLKKQEAEADPANMDPAALEAWAQAVSEGRAMPPLGLGKSKIRDWIVNRAGQIAAARQKEGGPGLTESAAGYKAGTATLTSLQKMRGNIGAFEQTAQKNLEIVQEQSKKVDKAGVPIIDKWLLAGKRSVAGDPEVSKLDTAIRVASNEVARVVNSANGSGVLSDTARKEIEAILNPAMTPEQIEGVIGIMKRDMGNRMKSLDEEIERTRKAMDLTPKKDAGQPAATHRYNMQTGQIEEIK